MIVIFIFDQKFFPPLPPFSFCMGSLWPSSPHRHLHLPPPLQQGSLCGPALGSFARLSSQGGFKSSSSRWPYELECMKTYECESICDECITDISVYQVNKIVKTTCCFPCLTCLTLSGLPHKQAVETSFSLAGVGLGSFSSICEGPSLVLFPRT